MKTNKRLVTSVFCKNVIKYFVLVALLFIIFLRSVNVINYY